MPALILFAILIILSAPAYAEDVLHLKNGDKLTGTVTSYSLNSVRLESKYGTFDIPIADVGGVISNQRVQKDIDFLINQHELASIPQEIIAPVPEPALPVESPPEAIEAEEEDKKYLGAKWSGNINLGANLKTGNSENQAVSADAQISGRWEKHKLTVQADYNREEDDSDITVDNRSLGLEHDYFVSKRWFIGNKAKFEQDEIDRLDLRTNLSTGIGFQAYERDDLNLRFLFGPGFLDEKFEDGSGDNSTTLNWATNYKQKFYNDLFRLFHNHELTAPTENYEDFLFQSKSGLSAPIRNGVVASAGVEFDWDNEPAAGTVEDDTTYSLKIGYEW